jgi:hypothetical protein
MNSVDELFCCSSLRVGVCLIRRWTSLRAGNVLRETYATLKRDHARRFPSRLGHVQRGKGITREGIIGKVGCFAREAEHSLKLTSDLWKLASLTIYVFACNLAEALASIDALTRRRHSSQASLFFPHAP